MANKKRPTRKGHAKHPPHPPSDAGLQAFRAGRLDDAIEIWSRRTEGNPQIAAALAEAYFRRALLRSAGDEQVADLEHSTTLAPEDLRYRYHLGLAFHRSGNRAMALQCYRTVLEHDATWPGAGMVLALAELEQDPRAELAHLPGSTPAVLQTLVGVQALLQGVMPPAGESPIERLWQGLGCIQANDGKAREILDATGQLPARHAGAVQHYYQGVTAAQAGDRAAALKSWEDAQDQQMDTPWLRQNVAAALVDSLSEQGEGDDPRRAVDMALHWRSLGAISPALGQALIQAFDNAAHAAVEAGDWERAATLWQEARQVLGATSGLGSPRSLLHNLAVAHEAQEHWLDAAEAWRAMLRTRPYGVAARADTEHTLASSAGAGELSEAQWRWVRGRVIECYRRAEKPGEAVAIFRQALKADPNDLEMRLQLADALIANEQDQSAINELRRVLQTDPDHVEAMLRLASLYAELGSWYAAESLVRQVLQRHPDRADVQRQLALLLLERGKDLHSRRQYEVALTALEEGWRIAPDDYHFPLQLARIAIEVYEMDRARSLLDQVLTLGGDQSFAYLATIECWAVVGELEEARAVLRRAETALPLLPDFYLEVGLLLLKRSSTIFGAAPFTQPAATPTSTPVSLLAEEVLDRAVASRPDDAHFRSGIAIELLQLRPDLALKYAESAASMSTREGHSLMVLGLAQAMNNRVRDAKETLRRAAAQARGEGDIKLALEIEDLRRRVGDPLLPLMLSMSSLFDDMDDDLFDL